MNVVSTHPVMIFVDTNYKIAGTAEHIMILSKRGGDHGSGNWSGNGVKRF